MYRIIAQGILESSVFKGINGVYASIDTFTGNSESLKFTLAKDIHKSVRNLPFLADLLIQPEDIRVSWYMAEPFSIPEFSI